MHASCKSSGISTMLCSFDIIFFRSPLPATSPRGFIPHLSRLTAVSNPGQSRTQGIDRSSLFSLHHPGFRPIPTNRQELATAVRWMPRATLRAKNTFTTGFLGGVRVRSNWLLFLLSFSLFISLVFFLSFFHLADGRVVCFGCVWS